MTRLSDLELSYLEMQAFHHWEVGNYLEQASLLATAIEKLGLYTLVYESNTDPYVSIYITRDAVRCTSELDTKEMCVVRIRKLGNQANPITHTVRRMLFPTTKYEILYRKAGEVKSRRMGTCDTTMLVLTAVGT